MTACRKEYTFESPATAYSLQSDGSDNHVDASNERVKVIKNESAKEHVNLVFVGHVDSGKSTLGGQLMYLTGMVDKRTIEKYEKEAKERGRESWYFSWCMDNNEEERAKGKTVEFGRARFETERKHFTILDAPGHRSFVPNMINAANQGDVAVLVISARKGEFETGFERGGQTREHALLVKTAGVRHLIILVNKMDDPSVNWEETRWNEIQNKFRTYLRSCGFNPDSDITYIPVSGLTGANLKDRTVQANAQWYTGPCFLDFLDVHLAPIVRNYDGPVRCTIASKHTDMGTMILGKMEVGVLEKGQTLVVMPNKQHVQVIECWCDDVEVDLVVAGDNVKLKLKGIEESEVQPGFVLCSPAAPCNVARIFDVELFTFELKSIICAGTSAKLHIHSAVEDVSVERILLKIDKKTQEKTKARMVDYMKPFEKAVLRLKSEQPFCMEIFKDLPALSRLTLRDDEKTIAIGKVVKIVE